MNKKGVSTIVSTVLIISIGVIISVTVFAFSGTFSEEILSKADQLSAKSMTCLQDVSFEITNACYEDNNVKIFVQGNGVKRINSFLIRLYSSGSNAKTFEDEAGLDPFMVREIPISWPEADKTAYIEILPSIILNNEETTCSDSKAKFGMINTKETIQECIQ